MTVTLPGFQPSSSIWYPGAPVIQWSPQNRGAPATPHRPALSQPVEVLAVVCSFMGSSSFCYLTMYSNHVFNQHPQHGIFNVS